MNTDELRKMLEAADLDGCMTCAQTLIALPSLLSALDGLRAENARLREVLGTSVNRMTVALYMDPGSALTALTDGIKDARAALARGKGTT